MARWRVTRVGGKVRGHRPRSRPSVADLTLNMIHHQALSLGNLFNWLLVATEIARFGYGCLSYIPQKLTTHLLRNQTPNAKSDIRDRLSRAVRDGSSSYLLLIRSQQQTFQIFRDVQQKLSEKKVLRIVRVMRFCKHARARLTAMIRTRLNIYFRKACNSRDIVWVLHKFFAAYRNTGLVPI